MKADDPIERLFALEQFGIKLGLENISVLADALGTPQAHFTSVHIAGTNGKGSVAAMVECGVRHAGYRTGRYTSPHLARIEERIAIDGRPIETHDFRDLAAHVLAVMDHLRTRGQLQATPTFFEVTTAIAFEAFRRARVEIAVIEVGLGGRFDATNIVAPSVTAITSIGLDHQKYLGSSLSSIAFEKAGILKSGVPAIVGEVPPEAREVIEGIARERGAPLTIADSTLVGRMSFESGRATISVITPRASYRDMQLALRGRHQVWNAVVAIRVLETLADQGLQVSDPDIRAALSEVQWPGRLEWLQLETGRRLLIDAAHNAAGADALARYLTDSRCAPLPIVLAVMRDKDVKHIVRALVPVASRFVATTADSPRALCARELATLVTSVAPSTPVVAVDDPTAAVATALAAVESAAAAGSIFLVGPLRQRLLAAGAISLQSP